MSSLAPTTACPIGHIDYSIFEPWSDRIQYMKSIRKDCQLGSDEKDFIFSGHRYQLFSEEGTHWWEDRCVTKITPENANSQEDALPSEEKQVIMRRLNGERKKSRENFAKTTLHFIEQQLVFSFSVNPIETESEFASLLEEVKREQVESREDYRSKGGDPAEVDRLYSAKIQEMNEQFPIVMAQKAALQSSLEELAKLTRGSSQRATAPVRRVSTTSTIHPTTTPEARPHTTSTQRIERSPRREQFSCITVIAIAILVSMFAVGVFGFAGLIPMGSILSGALVLVPIACAGVGFFCYRRS